MQTWGDFEQQFWVYFFPVNVEADTINTLEETSYHQGGHIVDDYLDSFQTLVSDAGYTDPWTLVSNAGYTNPWTLVVKFR